MPRLRGAAGKGIRLARRLTARVKWHVTARRAPLVPPAPLVAPTEPVPPFGLFRDIPVAPTQNTYDPGKRIEAFDLRCGPVFPQTGVEPWMRHCFGARAIDLPPHLPQPPRRRIARPCVWLGYLSPHFGHLVAEHGSRFLWSRVMRPDDRYLAALPFRTRPEQMPAHVWDVLAWYGIGSDRLDLVTQPLVARELRVYPQGEILEGAGPSGQYLDLLDRHVAASGLVPVPSRTLYVTRAGLLETGRGSQAGEDFLCARLAAAGVAILDPATAPLRHQLAAYLGAGTIVFSEGSAVHGRQMLGRLAQDLVILNRRPRFRMAESALRPRCRNLSYVEATAAVAVPQGTQQVDILNFAFSIPDFAVIGRVFRDLGHDISLDPGDSELVAALHADARIWAEAAAARRPGFRADDLQAVAVRAMIERGVGTQ